MCAQFFNHSPPLPPSLILRYENRGQSSTDARRGDANTVMLFCPLKKISGAIVVVVLFEQLHLITITYYIPRSEENSKNIASRRRI